MPSARSSGYSEVAQSVFHNTEPDKKGNRPSDHPHKVYNVLAAYHCGRGGAEGCERDVRYAKKAHLGGLGFGCQKFHPSQSSGGGMVSEGQGSMPRRCCIAAWMQSIEGRECGILTGGECIRISRRCLCAAGPRRRQCLRFPVYPVAVGAILITNNKEKSENLHRKQTSFFTVTFLHTRHAYAIKRGKVLSDSKLPGGSCGECLSHRCCRSSCPWDRDPLIKGQGQGQSSQGQGQVYFRKIIRGSLGSEGRFLKIRETVHVTCTMTAQGD